MNKLFSKLKVTTIEQLKYWYKKICTLYIVNALRSFKPPTQNWDWTVMKLDFLINKYNIRSQGIAHVGAWRASEIHEYRQLFGDIPVVFIEPNLKLQPAIEKNISPYSNVRCEYVALGAADKTALLNLNYSNPDEDDVGQSSSILEPLLHPPIGTSNVEIIVTTADELLKDDFIDFLLIDVQGYELEVLKGATNLLKNVKYLIIEVNKTEQYKGCPLVEDLDLFLSNYNFQRMETEWYADTEDWGDAFYTKIQHT